jgi:uncharacterized protein YbjQ (UPF0145 family)
LPSLPSITLTTCHLNEDKVNFMLADMHRLMFEHASQLGANAIITARYDTTEIAAGVTGILAYGTAV